MILIFSLGTDESLRRMNGCRLEDLFLIRRLLPFCYPVLVPFSLGTGGGRRRIAWGSAAFPFPFAVLGRRRGAVLRSLVVVLGKVDSRWLRRGGRRGEEGVVEGLDVGQEVAMTSVHRPARMLRILGIHRDIETLLRDLQHE